MDSKKHGYQMSPAKGGTAEGPNTDCCYQCNSRGQRPRAGELAAAMPVSSQQSALVYQVRVTRSDIDSQQQRDGLLPLATHMSRLLCVLFARLRSL